ncbi:hypothetical protein CC78DRAFT_584105 [Lojkania enalia]|uniref:Uncharacterized protein n=1 Tax=Lojkania enalia TaxID=147567 RepID=A0A9P4K188_9PLEO|nr:hypothetical protein CC78DRAFT_584105 [Didymosphaeria enalia]
MDEVERELRDIKLAQTNPQTEHAQLKQEIQLWKQTCVVHKAEQFDYVTKVNCLPKMVIVESFGSNYEVGLCAEAKSTTPARSSESNLRIPLSQTTISRSFGEVGTSPHGLDVPLGALDETSIAVNKSIPDADSRIRKS